MIDNAAILVAVVSMYIKYYDKSINTVNYFIAVIFTCLIFAVEKYVKKRFLSSFTISTSENKVFMVTFDGVSREFKLVDFDLKIGRNLIYFKINNGSVFFFKKLETMRTPEFEIELKNIMQ